MPYKKIIHLNIPACATTTHKRPYYLLPPIQKTKLFPDEMLQIGPFCNQLLKVTATIFGGFRGFNNFPLVLTFCE